ncbi:hypothetical protein H0H81_008767 [Sphagnurus paluster]|uniref:Peptidase S53 activation domain-containing protein n=1 Tax=Sphagnurus paluster TaxID=117069 RepID=A0A9P7K4K2_9AGAR|nr:hypothetical protein H0H81_008767 [Sphagnurus paluster]
MLRPLVLLAVLFPLYSAKPLYEHTTRAGYVVHEKRSVEPDWQLERRVAHDAPLAFRIGLKQRNLDQLPDLLLAVSDPASPSYGQHWTHEQIVSTFAPPETAVASVRAWLEAEGVEPKRIRRSVNQAWVEVRDATAGEVERLLDTEYHVYKRDGGGVFIASGSYSLPRSISDLVDFVTPTIQSDVGSDETHAVAPELAVLHTKRAAKPAAPTGCDNSVTPDCLRGLYNMTYTPKATAKNSLGIGMFHFSLLDMN